MNPLVDVRLRAVSLLLLVMLQSMMLQTSGYTCGLETAFPEI